MSDLLERITVDPAQCGGRPCIRGMRIRVIEEHPQRVAEPALGLLASASYWKHDNPKRTGFFCRASHATGGTLMSRLVMLGLRRGRAGLAARREGRIMARALILALFLVSSVAHARTLKCNGLEEPWVGQIGGKPARCCVDDSRFYSDPDPVPQDSLVARCRLGAHQSRYLVLSPQGDGSFRVMRGPSNRGLKVQARPRCTVTATPGFRGPVAGQIHCKRITYPFSLAPVGGAPAAARVDPFDPIRPGWWTLGPRKHKITIKVNKYRGPSDIGATTTARRLGGGRVLVQAGGGALVVWEGWPTPGHLAPDVGSSDGAFPETTPCWNITEAPSRLRVRGVYQDPCWVGPGIPFVGRKVHP